MYWCGNGGNSQGALERWSVCEDVSFLADTAVCAKHVLAGGDFVVAVSERHQQLRDGRGVWSVAGAGS